MEEKLIINTGKAFSVVYKKSLKKIFYKQNLSYLCITNKEKLTIKNLKL